MFKNKLHHLLFAFSLAAMVYGTGYVAVSAVKKDRKEELFLDQQSKVITLQAVAGQEVLATYVSDANGVFQGDIELPRNNGFVILDGKGQKIILGKNSNGITTPVPSGVSPLTATSTAYIIKNLTIQGGKSAIRLSATFNSQLNGLYLIGQEDVAIHCQFALMTDISNVNIVNPGSHGVYLGTGSFGSWGTNLNSQCNGSTVRNVRVYNKLTGTGNSFNIEHSNGVRLLDCISEGHPQDGYAVWYNGQNSTVKNFEIRNFHLEHAPKKGGICIDAQANTINVISGVFAQKYGSSIPWMVIKNNAPVIIENMGWWTPSMYIWSEEFAPRITIRDCHFTLRYSSIKTSHARGIYKPYIWINGKNPG